MVMFFVIELRCIFREETLYGVCLSIIIKQDRAKVKV